MPELVRIRGVRIQGKHGVPEAERERPQPFVVDLEVVVEAMEDELEATADYDQIVRIVRGLVATESFHLIETLARRIAEVVAGQPGVLSCRATVHKPRAADALGIGDVSAEAVAGRSS